MGAHSNVSLDVQQQMRRMWSVIQVGQHNPISLRAISPRGMTPKLRTMNKTFTATVYPDVEARQSAFETEALRLNGLGYNVYIVMNPIRPDFGTVTANGAAVCDVDIECRLVLLIDFDRAGVTTEPATDGEVAAAVTVARAVAQYLRADGWPPPARALSGNGMHLYFRLDDLPNDDTSKMLVTTLLRLLASKFNTLDIKIDTAVTNASRVTKLCGTIARKGSATEHRPFRMAVMIDDRSLTAVTVEDIERAIGALQASNPIVAPARRPQNGSIQSKEPDTPRRRADLSAMLARISADCDYVDYRNVVWAILSTGWADAEAIARQWCKTAPNRYDEADFNEIVKRYDPTRRVRHSLGTIRHLSRAGG